MLLTLMIFTHEKSLNYISLSFCSFFFATQNYKKIFYNKQERRYFFIKNYIY